ncbi:MAG TPA: ABC-2 transporter permease [Candidatus Limiplasma sp.]|nr:ABC-2 transporter permease [Candidatus Limiplasma sp.]
MKALLYKEFKLVVNPLFYCVALFSALILIPQWLYFIALLYFCFMSAPNLFTLSKTYKEVYFTATLPVLRRDVVKARLVSLVVLEVLQIVVAAVCVVLKLTVMTTPNYIFLDGNLAFLGLSFVMFGLFNIVLLPMFYQTAYKIAMPAILATVVSVAFAAAVELGVIYLPAVADLFDGMHTTAAHVITLAAGIAVFAGLNIAAYRVSAARFETVDL